MDDDDFAAPAATVTKRYEKIAFIGEGQFATVWKARDTHFKSEDGLERIVAVKKIKQGRREEIRDGINRTALREIKLLQELHHENLLELLDVYGGKHNISLVMEFMSTDLEVVIRDSNIVLTPAHIKRYTLDTLMGLRYLHRRCVLHRDLKPNNLLISRLGVIKIGDFGLARFVGSPGRQYTHEVVTRWYRCPELLFGATSYGDGVDMWALACIMAEMLIRTPLFPGESDLDQLDKIFEVTGTPTDECWPGVQELRDFVCFKQKHPIPLENVFRSAPDDLLLVISNLLQLNPVARISADNALQMSFFSNPPYPTLHSALPKVFAGNEENAKFTTRPPMKHKNADGENLSMAKKLIFD